MQFCFCWRLVPKDSIRHLQCLPVRVVHGHWQFFFPLPILSFKITTASPVLEHCGEKTSRLFLAKTKSNSLVRIDQPPKNPKNRQHNLQGRDREGRTVQKRFFGWKAFPFDPECFRDFQQKILLTWKAPQEIIAFQRPLSRALKETSAQDPSPHPL